MNMENHRCGMFDHLSLQYISDDSSLRISLTKALVLWWCDNKSDLI